jgi:hypothetical protein
MKMRVTSIEETEHYDSFKKGPPIPKPDSRGVLRIQPEDMVNLGVKVRTKIVKFECDNANLTLVLERVGESMPPVGWQSFEVGAMHDVTINGTGV